ncbi:MAG TPA: RNA polymerase sigma factor [Planctomycetaceae bacterium]|nr:RNA polymerase sigma factor [Planctomycetaceae bacterium]
MNGDDVALVRRCLNGEEAGLRAFIERFQGIVFGLCYRMLGHREDAEDVAQEVFLRVFKSLHRWDVQRPLKPWVLQIAVNRCRTFLAKRAKRPVQAADHALQALVAEDRCAERDIAEEVQNALESLREDYRTCFVLFYQQQLSCAEIAQVMGCPEGTVKTWLHRARHELAERLRRRGITPDTCHELRRV